MSSMNYVITIGRQLGSGGAVLGKAIASHFGFKYLDKEILVKASEMLNVAEPELKRLDEKSVPIWNYLVQATVWDTPYMAPEWYVPTGARLYGVQSRIMKKAVEESPCVIVGRCGSHIFRKHRKHLSIFLHAEEEYRVERLKNLLDISENDAKKRIEKVDKERARYFNNFTGRRWLDLTEYDLCLDTGVMSDSMVKDVIVQYITGVFPELKK